jgi:hypothetical protein
MAGCHEVVWPVGSSSRGKAPVEAFGPGPGTTGIPCGPPIVPEVAGGAWGAVADGAVVPLEGESAGGATGAAEARGISGIGLSDGDGVAAGVGARTGGCVACGWMPACGIVGMKLPDCGVIGCW